MIASTAHMDAADILFVYCFEFYQTNLVRALEEISKKKTKTKYMPKAV